MCLSSLRLVQIQFVDKAEHLYFVHVFVWLNKHVEFTNRIQLKIIALTCKLQFNNKFYLCFFGICSVKFSFGSISKLLFNKTQFVIIDYFNCSSLYYLRMYLQVFRYISSNGSNSSTLCTSNWRKKLAK